MKKFYAWYQKHITGDKFTESTADEYLVVSANQYGTMVSKAFRKSCNKSTFSLVAL